MAAVTPKGPSATRPAPAKPTKATKAARIIKAKPSADAKTRTAARSPAAKPAKLITTKASPSVRKDRAARRVEKTVAPKLLPKGPPASKIHGEGPVRHARNLCARTDPGEAMVCADSRLAARDRQLQAAYRNAEASGVPSAALRRQQARWVQARAAAAREAPWAVEDVYEARISELNALTRDARVD